MERLLRAALGCHVTLWVDSCPLIEAGIKGRVIHVGADYVTLRLFNDRPSVMIPLTHISGMLDEVLTDEQVMRIETQQHRTGGP